MYSHVHTVHDSLGSILLDPPQRLCDEESHVLPRQIDVRPRSAGVHPPMMCLSNPSPCAFPGNAPLKFVKIKSTVSGFRTRVPPLATPSPAWPETPSKPQAFSSCTCRKTHAATYPFALTQLHVSSIKKRRGHIQRPRQIVL
ncbi:hypothetical protein Agabi119p4_9723 [Agaricus bisporus var. burnettii]|uniref:Uncharacterized protein n=1 Tax=Agaricus bisporus var. burnettii TaxID=192524 RepID=A0A8H7C3K5_AGABI|nr:hypothetical protein Agabi119p4_9723 [Agaricus bisporus var. burnettii]